MLEITSDMVKETFEENWDDWTWGSEELPIDGVFSFPDRFYQCSDGSWDLEENPTISYVRSEDSKVETMEYDISYDEESKEIVISGIARVEYTALGVCRGSIEWEADEVVTSGDDKYAVTASFEITGWKYDSEKKEVDTKNSSIDYKIIDF